MGTSIRDWQLLGIDLKVEVATSGALTVGNTQTDMPFQTGGVGGVPLGWTPNAPDTTRYNYTTAQGVFSLSNATSPAPSAYTGISYPSFPITPGYRYQVGIQGRVMAGKIASMRAVNVFQSKDGGANWFNMMGTSQPAQANWEDILLTSPVVPAGYTLAYILLQMNSNPPGTAGMWGTQFQGLFRRQLDLAPPPIVWHDITCDVKGIGIRYGRERFTNRYDVSTLSVDLDNNAGLYSFHTNHPLNLQPGRQVRVTATYKGVTYPQAFHVLDTITDAFTMDGRAVSHWQCVDPTATVLGNAKVVGMQALTMSGGGVRIGVLLDSVGYAPRKLDPGSWWMQQVTSSGSTIRDEAGVTADSDGGNFFADREGYCVFKDRTWGDVDPKLNNVQADLVAYPHDGPVMPIVDTVPTDPNAPLICVNQLATDWSLARVINIVTLANRGGSAHTYTDAESAKQFGPQTYQRTDFVLGDDTHLPDRANDMMNNYTQPVLRVNSVGFAPGVSGAWEFTLGVFLNWMIRVWYTHPINYWGYAVALHIQSIEHRISPTDWSTIFTVDLPESFVELTWATTWGWDAGLWDDVIWDQDTATHGALFDSGYNWSVPTSVWGV